MRTQTGRQQQPTLAVTPAVAAAPLKSPTANVSPFIRYLALIALCAQNCALVLTMKYSRAVLHETYLSSAVVVCMEMTKLVICTAVMMRDGHSINDLAIVCRRSLPMVLPSVMYVGQNTLQLIAIKHIEASTFSILSQLKTISSAVCTVLMLKDRVISGRQWRALLLLVVGAVLVQLPSDQNAHAASDDANKSVMIGLSAIIGNVTLSGIAGIYLEGQLKAVSLWERNLQLSLWGTLFALAGLMYDADIVATKGFFHGFTLVTLAVIALAAAGGLIVAAVVKYTNTIIKNFATSMGIVLTSIISLFLFDVKLGTLFWMGTTVVVISIFNYNDESPIEPIVSTVVVESSSRQQNGHSRPSRLEELVPLVEDDPRR